MLALISLLIQVSRGEVDLAAMIPVKQPAAKKIKKSKPAQPDTVRASTAEADATGFVERELGRLRKSESRIRETRQAFARMFPDDAALLLAELDPVEASSILAKLQERQLAPILEQAPPIIAAQWVEVLIAEPSPPVIPPQFMEQAYAAGLIDELPAASDGPGAAGEEPTLPAEDSGAAPESTATPAGEGSATPADPPADNLTSSENLTNSTEAEQGSPAQLSSHELTEPDAAGTNSPQQV